MDAYRIFTGNRLGIMLIIIPVLITPIGKLMGVVF